MNSARNRILNKLKTANAAAPTQTPVNFEPWGFDNTKTESEKMERFCQALTASHAEVKQVNQSALSNELEKLCQEKSWTRAATGTQGKYLDDIKQGMKSIDTIEYDNDIEKWKTALFHEIDVGISHVLAGIADTGALVLWPDEHEPRTLSLVPPCHIAIMNASSLYNHFLQVVEQQNWSQNMPTNALLISGPSKTADIQQTLAYGAHGPSELIVIIVTDK